MRRFFLSLGLVLLLVSTAHAALSFPPLTGRVVDAAHILSPRTQNTLTQELAGFEAQTTKQIVVVTLPSLQGSTIEDYGYQLGRMWGIGQKGKDNGALLIVAPVEHKVRIEVGYGLEDTLTDVLSNTIIQTYILPDFRSGHMEQGVVEGTHAILSVLTDPEEAARLRASPMVRNKPVQESPLMSIMTLIIFFILIFAVRSPYLNLIGLGFRSGGFGGGSGGGGFSGGGGGFGGGGASGSW